MIEHKLSNSKKLFDRRKVFRVVFIYIFLLSTFMINIRCKIPFFSCCKSLYLFGTVTYFWTWYTTFWTMFLVNMLFVFSKKSWQFYRYVSVTLGKYPFSENMADPYDNDKQIFRVCQLFRWYGVVHNFLFEIKMPWVLYTILLMHSFG